MAETEVDEMWQETRDAAYRSTPEEIEVRLKENAITGLVNIYHALTGQDCPRHLSLGMATSAVSSLKHRAEANEKKIARLKEALRELVISPIGFDDSRISYVSMQVDRNALEVARAALSEEE
jgi:hypothetical protein